MKINSQTIMQEKAVVTSERKSDNDFAAVLNKVKNEKDDKKLMEACQEMEAVFVQELFKQMRATVPENEFIPEGTASKIYQSMLDKEYSLQAAKSHNSLGLAEMLYEQLKADAQAGEQEDIESKT